MENFEEIKLRLKKKWLQYYKHNRQWINKYCQENCFTSVQGSTEGETWGTAERSIDDKRYREVHPPSELIIGAITALEPFLAQYWLTAFVDLYANKEKIVVALGLNFDPELELKKIEQQNWQNQHQTIIEPELLIEGDSNQDTHYLSTNLQQKS
jgi:hypothetical protein